MRSSLSHVAVLVPSARKASVFLNEFGFDIGPEEEFEETREIYVQGGEHNPLLLMEPKGAGSYQKALAKRGPGVHHFAVDVLALESFLETLAGSGWLLHLNSLRTIPKLRTAYLARPGFPALIEVHEKKKLGEGKPFVEKVALDLGPNGVTMAQAAGLGGLLVSSKSGATLTIRGRELPLASLF